MLRCLAWKGDLRYVVIIHCWGQQKTFTVRAEEMIDGKSITASVCALKQLEIRLLSWDITTQKRPFQRKFGLLVVLDVLVRESVKPVCFILWGTWMSTESFMLIHPVVVEMDQSESLLNEFCRRWTSVRYLVLLVQFSSFHQLVYPGKGSFWLLQHLCITSRMWHSWKLIIDWLRHILVLNI